MKRISANIKGVTLIELIVVLAIVAISAAMVAPNMSGWMAKTKLNAETRKMYSVFQRARSEAIKCNCDVCVDVDWANKVYSSFYGTDAAYGNGTGNPPFITPKTPWPKGIKMYLTGYPNPGGDTTWNITSRGSFVTGDVTINDWLVIESESTSLVSPNNKKTLELSIGGAVTIK